MKNKTAKESLKLAKERVEMLRGNVNQLLLNPDLLSVVLSELSITLEELLFQYDELSEKSQQLEGEHYYYQKVFSLSPVCHLVTNPQGVIERANRAAATLLNVSRRFLIGKPLVLYVAEKDRKLFTSSIEQLSTNNWELPTNNWELLLKPRDKDPFPISVNIFPIQAQSGQIIALRWLLRAVLSSGIPVQPQTIALTPTNLISLHPNRYNPELESLPSCRTHL